MTCKGCGTPVDTINSFCSKSCYQAWYRRYLIKLRDLKKQAYEET